MDKILALLIALTCIVGIAAGGIFIFEKAPRIKCFDIPYIYAGCGVVK